MKKVTDLIYKGKEFVVVDLGEKVDPEFGNRFGTINKDFIKEGKITKKMNGLEMCLSKSADQAIQGRKDQIDYSEMKASGLSDLEILQKIYGVQA